MFPEVMVLKKLYSLFAVLLLACSSCSAEATEGLPPLTAEVTNTDALFDPKGKTVEALEARQTQLREASLSRAAQLNLPLSEVLSRLMLTYDQLIGAQKTSDQRADELAALTATPPAPLGDGPFSLAAYDTQLSKLSDLKAQADVLSVEINSAALNLSASDKAAREAETAFRSLRDRGNAEETDKALAALAVENARLNTALWRTNKESNEKANKGIALLIDRQRKILEHIGAHLDRSDAALAAYFDPQKEQLAEQAALLQKQSAQAEAQLAKLGTAPLYHDTRLDELSAGLWAQKRAALTTQINALQENAGNCLKARDLLDLRRKGLAGQFQKKNEELTKELTSLKSQIEALNERIESLQKSGSATQGRLSSLARSKAETSGQEAQLLTQTEEVLRQQLVNNSAAIEGTIKLRDAARDLTEELNALYDSVDVTERVAGLWKSKFGAVMNTELWSSGDYTVRLRSLIAALILLSLGAFISRKMSHGLVNRAARRWNMDGTTSSLLKRFSFYILLFVCFLLALNLVGIPLTAFAFLGGAFAIAFGFGAQNLFSNLISGILLAANKPFRIEDVVEIDGITAVVKQLGSRSTRLRTFDGKDVILPNSKLIDSRLINWNLSDKIFRGQINIGLSYDCNPQEAADLMLNLVKQHKNVLPDPEAFILFTDFGPSSLNFSIYFWVDTRVTAAATVASELRFRLFEALKNAGVSIPFPQLDVHFDPEKK